MAGTYEPITTTTITSNVTEFTLSSIPGTYTDLILVIDGSPISGGTAMDSNWRVNGDSGTNYSDTRWQDAVSDRGSSTTFSRAGQPWNNYRYTQIIQFFNYSNTTTYKTALTRSGNPNVVEAYCGLWRSTAAITSITMISGQSRNYTNGTVVSLYGIKAA